jgi:hypothetical protein
VKSRHPCYCTECPSFTECRRTRKLETAGLTWLTKHRPALTAGLRLQDADWQGWGSPCTSSSCHIWAATFKTYVNAAGTTGNANSCCSSIVALALPLFHRRASAFEVDTLVPAFMDGFRKAGVTRCLGGAAGVEGKVCGAQKPRTRRNCARAVLPYMGGSVLTNSLGGGGARHKKHGSTQRAPPKEAQGPSQKQERELLGLYEMLSARLSLPLNSNSLFIAIQRGH